MVARVLAGRGLDTPPDYSLGRLLPPRFAGMGAAVDLLAEAVTGGRRILVVGDFDADGATGTALAVRALRAMGATDVVWRVPDRIRHGYGLSPGLVAECRRLDPWLLVTVDQGISSFAGVEAARAAGIRVVVTDHHLAPPELPRADAIVNPNCPGDPFPSKCLAGVGVMFYTMTALRGRLRDAGWFRDRGPRLDSLLDLVAVGTVADLVPLDENNRLLIWQGLQRIRAGRACAGVQALLEVAGRNTRTVEAADLGFAVGPRLNAAGRLEDMGIGIRCLLADDEKNARALAEQLDDINRDRRALQADMTETAERQVEDMLAALEGDCKGLCVFDPDWHAGVVGLVAARLKERLQRPVVAMAPAGDGSDEIKGSGRSPGGVHMRDLLVDIDTTHPGLIDRFGGHARAAGLSLTRDRVDAFRNAFEAAVEGYSFEAESVWSDGELPGEYLDVETARALSEAGPWGQEWPEPLFDGSFRVADRRIVGGSHLKLVLQPAGGGEPVEAIAFGGAPLAGQDLPSPLHVTYRLEINRWRGRIQSQLNIQHLVRGLRSA